MKKVISAGHVCIDITPVFPNRKVVEISDILRPGKLIQMGDVSVSTGGSVANTGLGMKLLGGDVILMGKIGNDEFGDMIAGILSKYGVVDGMIRSNVSTSYSVVLAIPGIDRIFLHNPGANDVFSSDDINENMLSEAAHFHFGYPPLMRSMYENNGEELIKIFKKVKEAGLSTSLDLAAVDVDSEAGKANWSEILKNVIPYVDFFVPSIEELCFMLDRPRFEKWQKQAAGRDITEILDVDEDIRPLAQKCIEMGAKVVLLKCGAPGMYCLTADRDSISEIGKKAEINIDNWANKDIFEKSYKPEQILSGTGAGDTSIAAFIVSMLNGESLEMSIQLAAATGACCVSAYDALSGLKSLDELKEKINSGWDKFAC